MPRDYRLYLKDILVAARKIDEYLRGVSFNAFSQDEMRVDAVLRNLARIGR